jgi:lipopolysaccharide/colanic/teichoic acid biosynthesis glycosyltransferase
MTKRIFDIIASIIGIALLAPLFIIIAILIKLDSKGSVFFMQERIGRNGCKFRICKFRTMQTIQSSDSLKITIGTDTRITKTGSFLRKYKIDELPQLFNVLAGQMSIVGPRPEVEEYVNYYSKINEDIVLSVRPGITDLASVRFRNESDILTEYDNPEKAYIEKILPRKLRYCRFYVERQSICLDIKIIWITILAIVNK